MAKNHLLSEFLQKNPELFIVDEELLQSTTVKLKDCPITNRKSRNKLDIILIIMQQIDKHRVIALALKNCTSIWL